MVNLVCTFLRRTRQLSRWLSKEEVRRWDMFLGHTELRWSGCSTESIQIPKIQITYVDTKNQMADMLTKGSFTRYEWNHLLHLFNIIYLSTFSRSHFILKNRKRSLNSRWVAERIRYSIAPGNRCKRAQIICLCTLKRGHKESQAELVPSNLTRM